MSASNFWKPFLEHLRRIAGKEGISKKGAGERAQQAAFQRALELLVPNWVGHFGDHFWLNAHQQGGEHTNTP